MASVVAIRSGIQTRLETIAGLRVTDHVAGQVNPPAAVIIPGDGTSGNWAISFDATMGRGSDDFMFTILILVSDSVERVSNEALDGYLAGSGAKSVKAAVDGDLGGNAHFANVVGVRDYGRIQYGGVVYVGAEFIVEVTA